MTEAVAIEDVVEVLEAHVGDERLRDRLERAVRRDAFEAGEHTEDELRRIQDWHEHRTEKLVAAASSAPRIVVNGEELDAELEDFSLSVSSDGLEPRDDVDPDLRDAIEDRHE